MILLLSATLEVQPSEAKGFFHKITQNVFKRVADLDGQSTIGDTKESKVSDSLEDTEESEVSDSSIDTEESDISNSLADIIADDCESVCPPVGEGDYGAHVIQCTQCIAEEFGMPIFPEFLESVLAIRSPELLEGEGEGEETEKEGPKYLEDLDLQLEWITEDCTQLLGQVTDTFEEQGVALFSALLGQCKEDCSSVTVPHSDPVHCLKCMAAYTEKENAEFIDNALALF